MLVRNTFYNYLIHEDRLKTFWKV